MPFLNGLTGRISLPEQTTPSAIRQRSCLPLEPSLPGKGNNIKERQEKDPFQNKTDT
jgi:hypothetical protein